MKIFSSDPYVLSSTQRTQKEIREHPNLYIEAYTVADFFYKQISSRKFISIGNHIDINYEESNIATIIDFVRYDGKIKTFIGTLDYIFNEEFTLYSEYRNYSVNNRQYLRLIFPHLCNRLPFDGDEMKFISIYNADFCFKP